SPLATRHSPLPPLSTVQVLYEDNHLLVVNKPAGLATMGAQSGEASVHQWACDYLRKKYNKPGNVFVGVVSRLDAKTTGTLVLARTSKAASRLSIQFGGPGKHKKVSTKAVKIYLAVVEGHLEHDSRLTATGTLIDSVWKDETAMRMRTATSPREDAKEARLEYELLHQSADAALVAVRLATGRKHQIRLQFADRGHPILGDRKYGSRVAFPSGVALHSWRLLISHPTTEERMELTAELPQAWRRSLSWLPPTLETGLW
ncbi:MAG: RluA family pseudouridine synthase, partial [Planctomycetota bacterium]